MRITGKGQVTIPKDIRDRTGMHPGTGTSGMTTDEIMEMTRGPYDDIDSH